VTTCKRCRAAAADARQAEARGRRHFGWALEIGQTCSRMPQGPARVRLVALTNHLAGFFVALEDQHLPKRAVEQIVKTICVVLSTGKPMGYDEQAKGKTA
jgi:hypothetical protein